MAEIDLAQPSIDQRGNSNYAPCRTGLHLCGATPDGEQPYTAANFPADGRSDAMLMFDAAKAIAECGKEEADFCCDLMINGDHVDDFWTNRQLFPALRARLMEGEGEK